MDEDLREATLGAPTEVNKQIQKNMDWECIIFAFQPVDAPVARTERVGARGNGMERGLL
ncbi:hypothetical protein [Vitiosangium sp. GDMCC 1.1324]|uniref:hypothetical protein n=1 Tax=Vitiosangium sp. (strain GDMCC 1.1324) TaxID=2138576 RepID=UPI00130EA1BD|nr:hypothetical protein [Vitiosangium sp. GDMCC 1.1324]